MVNNRENDNESNKSSNKNNNDNGNNNNSKDGHNGRLEKKIFGLNKKLVSYMLYSKILYWKLQTRHGKQFKTTAGRKKKWDI